MNRFEVKAICTMVFPDIFANNKHDAIQEVINRLPTNVEKDGVLKCAVIVDDVKAECCDLMDTSNNHTQELVERINLAYNESNEEFIEIVRLLSNRDSMEIVATINRLPSSLSDRELCREYCMNVADDIDLQAILNYCRL